MSVVMLFCAYMAFLYVPWDFLSKPVTQAQEVWFGILLSGWTAKATEPLHFLIYLTGALGFWRMRSWMHPWAALYALQVAVGMLVWNLVDERGGGLPVALVSAVPFLILSVLLWRARTGFSAQQPVEKNSAGTMRR
ncbi:MAG: hypothetical protein R3F41_07885 [Gammaproteobacteria bacterium]|nr:hypothetical protein [Pseudomonadales bacterium]